MGQREPFASGVGQLGLLTHGGYVSPLWDDDRDDSNSPDVMSAV